MTRVCVTWFMVGSGSSVCVGRETGVQLQVLGVRNHKEKMNRDNKTLESIPESLATTAVMKT